MLACDGVIFLYGHSIWVVAAVLACHVCVARASGGAKFDYGPVFLAGHLELHTLGLQLSDNRVDTALVDDLQALRANCQRHGLLQAGHVKAAFLNVRVEATLGSAVRV